MIKEGVMEYQYTVLFQPAEEGGFVVTCPALPGVVTEGDTLEEARAMAQDAIRGYIESLQKDHLPIPCDALFGNGIGMVVGRMRTDQPPNPPDNTVSETIRVPVPYHV
jgi:predicted RNase H-like HicB family nuclease